MRPFRDQPIRRKLTAMLILVVSIVLLLQSVFRYVLSVNSAKEGMIRESTMLAKVLAASCDAALSYDPVSVQPESLYRVVAAVPAYACAGADEQTPLYIPRSVEGSAGTEIGRGSDLIDWALARKNTGHDPALLNDLIEIFLGECPNTLSRIAQAIDTSDAGLLRRAAHMMKGSAAIFGSQPVVDAALCLEIMGREKNLADARPALNRLESQIARLVNVLENS